MPHSNPLTNPANLTHLRVPQRVVSKLTTSVSPGNLLEIQILSLSYSIYLTLVILTHTYSLLTLILTEPDSLNVGLSMLRKPS